MVVLGGSNCAAKLLNSVEVYSSGSWSTPLPAMNTNRSDYPASGYAVISGEQRIYVCGGWATNSLKTCEYLNIGLKKWNNIPANMSIARSYPLSVVLSDGVSFIICGGHNGYYENLGYQRS